MLKSLKSSRKRLQSRLSSLSSSSTSSSEHVSLHTSSSEPARESSATTVEAFVHQTSGGYKFHSESSPRVIWSSAGYQSRCPFGDINVFQPDKLHILAAVISCSPTAQGGRYLQRHLQRELHHQIKHQGGNIQAALPAALRALNEAFRDMHPFNGPVLEGVKLTLAYMDAKTKMLHAASNGGCRLVVGRRLQGGEVHVVADVGRSVSSGQPSSSKEGKLPSHSTSSSTTSSNSSSSTTIRAGAGVEPSKEQRTDPLESVQFASVLLRREGIDTVILGSEGLWHELPSDKALLRLRHYHDATPEANGGNPAMHLANFALHAVAARSGRMQDPRMRSLRSVAHLQSLYAGDRSLYKWGKRQPVRRRRGDVHGDLSAIVLHLEWAGSGGDSQHSVGKKSSKRAHAVLHAMLPLHRATSAASLAASERAQRRWDLLRMHFLDFPLHSKRLTCQKWAALAESALERSRELRHRRQAAEMLLRKGLLSDGSLYRSSSPQNGSPTRPRSPSGGWQPAARALGTPGSSVSSQSTNGSSQVVLDSLRTLLKQGPPEGQSRPFGQEPAQKGQALVPDSRESSWDASPFSHQSSWQSGASSAFQHGSLPAGAPAVPRTVSRRNLMAPVQAPSLPVVMERGESQGLRESVKALHDRHMGSRFGQPEQPDARSQDWQPWLAYQKQIEGSSLHGQSNTVRAF